MTVSRSFMFLSLSTSRYDSAELPEIVEDEVHRYVEIGHET